jgi:TatD DNase family protein
MYVDVHTHLTHQKFASDRDAVIQKAIDAGLGAIVVNGLEPKSNREILAMAEKYPQIKPALGLYPIDAVNGILPDDFPIAVEKFDVNKEIQFIKEQAESNNLIAVGECGLDAHWLDDKTFKEQERVFEELIQIAMNSDIPVIIHTRKLEKRSAEILAHHQVKRVNFHCFGGKVKLAIKLAESHGWSFSIPANARVNEAFTKMLKELPLETILTETDAPYLAPVRGERNDPSHVVQTVSYLAELRQMDTEQARDLVWGNFKKLFKIDQS